MAAIQCPSCGHHGEVPDTFRGQSVRCPKCRGKLKVPERFPLLAILVVAVLLLGGAAAGYFFLLKKDVVEESPPPVAEAPPPPEPSPAEKKPEPVTKQEPEVIVKKSDDPPKDDEARLEEARKKEEERLALEQARQEKERKEREAAAAKLQALKRNPPLSAQLEEIEKEPVKFVGKYLTVDRISVKMSAIDKHRELGRYTLGVTSQAGTYYSRVPLGGLVVSTTEKAAKQLVEKAGVLDVLPRIKLFCEIRRWDKGGKAYPEVFAYRIEIYDSAGRVDAVVEVPPDP